MTFTQLTYELDGPVALIGLNRPAKRNAISDIMIGELQAAVLRAGREARVGLLHGHGDHFSAGLDLAEQLERTTIESMANSRLWHRVFDDIERGSIPFVAALRGGVIGGGLELAASAHIRVAGSSAFFALPEGQRGIFVGGGGAVRIARLVSVARMTDMMLTGRTLSAAEAERLNLVQYLVDDANVLDEARRIAVRIADNAPMSNYAITNALSRTQDMSHDDGLFFEALMAAVTQNSGDARERLKDFLEKRTARIGLKRAHD
jgi:enoyl-CoA hydratase/carnithine racemase